MTSTREQFELAAKRVIYNAESGVFTWKPAAGTERTTLSWNSRYAGTHAGTANRTGHIVISVRVQGKDMRFLAHRLAWFITRGEIPTGDIDHINQNPSDNRFCNLRDVPHAINLRNARLRSDNTSGHPGVSPHKKNGRWRARVVVNGKAINLGYFSSQQDAVTAAILEREKHGFTKSHGGR